MEVVERYVEQARSRGVDEIAFTEHAYYFKQTRQIWTIPYQSDRAVHDLDTYCDVVLEARRSGLPVKLGLEIDHVGERQQHLAELLEPYPFDLLLGSVHFVDDLAVDFRPGAWDELRVGEVWRSYVAALSALAESGTVDVLAHPDLAKIYGERPGPDVLCDLHRAIADAAHGADVAIEISSAGLRKPVGEIYPDAALLAACVQRGVPITTASDAHQPYLVGEDFDQVVAQARRGGYTEVAVFDQRARRLEPLG
ncbi:MAG: histidinol-phosphatase HisJ family protein [Gaiellales bacterium]